MKSWRFDLSVSLSSLLVAIKIMRVPRQYWEKRTESNSEQENSLFSSFLFFFFFFNVKARHETTALLLWNDKFYSQWASFKRVFFLLWSVWPLIYLMVLLESASVVGFAGKAPFHCSGPNRATAMLRSWLNRTSTFCVPPAAFLLSSWFSKKHCALPHLYLSSLLLCFFFSTWWVLFSCDAPF